MVWTKVQKALRASGERCYFTMDAGPNIGCSVWRSPRPPSRPLPRGLSGHCFCTRVARYLPAQSVNQVTVRNRWKLYSCWRILKWLTPGRDSPLINYSIFMSAEVKELKHTAVFRHDVWLYSVSREQTRYALIQEALILWDLLWGYPRSGPFNHWLDRMSWWCQFQVLFGIDPQGLGSSPSERHLRHFLFKLAQATPSSTRRYGFYRI